MTREEELQKELMALRMAVLKHFRRGSSNAQVALSKAAKIKFKAGQWRLIETCKQIDQMKNINP